jgi:hypothetical protein
MLMNYIHHNNKKLLPCWILPILLQFIPVHSYSQKIENVVSEVSGSNIHIYYDLLEAANDQPVFIRVYLSTDGGKSFGEPLKSVIGDVGMVVGSGRRKQIIWDVFAEVDDLVSESVKFRVKADLLSDRQRPPLKPGFQLGLSSHLGSKVHLASYGFNLKAAIRLKQFGLGIRGEYYKSYGIPPIVDEFDNYMGFSGGAVAEYDFIKDPKYSFYPFVCIGQTKIEQQSESSSNDYAGYSIYYSAGTGFDFNLANFICLGVEIEYIMAPVIDIDDQGGSSVVDRIVMDGIWAGITLKFVKQPGK